MCQQRFNIPIIGDEPADQDKTTASIPAPGTLPVDREVGPYRILELVGEGGMGSVYVADRGQPCFVMEYVPGIPITAYCDKHQLGNRERLDLFVQVSDAIQHAHQRGIIHRDVKPSNVLISIQVIDFGVAKAISQRLTEKTLLAVVDQMAVGELTELPLPSIAENAFTAMAYYRLGQADKARSELERLRRIAGSRGFDCGPKQVEIGPILFSVAARPAACCR